MRNCIHTVPQNKDKFTINNLFHCCEALILHTFSYEFLCGPKHMGTPVVGKLGQYLESFYSFWLCLGAFQPFLPVLGLTNLERVISFHFS